MRWCVWGHSGWIGTMVVDLLKQQGEEVHLATSRTWDVPAMEAEVDAIHPDRILNLAGITGRPTVDWCEDHAQETFRANAIGTANLAHVAWTRGIHVTYYATGCIYGYTPSHPMGTTFSELDPPNFTGSTYSRSKVLAEELLQPYSNVLTLRIRLPISADWHPKNILSKLRGYTRVTDIPNSFTVLPEMLPISIDMARASHTGIYNFTNPGTLKHADILNLYRTYVDPTHTWTTFTEEEQNAILRSPRSNCALDVTALLSLYPVTPITDAIVRIFQTMPQ